LIDEKMGIPNVLTAFRIFCVPIFVLSLIYYDRLWEATPFLIFCVASLSDALDGAIARVFKQKTHLGAVLDPIADKLLLNTAFIYLSLQNSFTYHSSFRFPSYVPVIVVSRDVIIVAGILLSTILKRRIEIIPTIVGKICTLFQMLSIWLILLKSPVSVWGWRVAIVFTIISGLDYSIKGLRSLAKE
jgi:cardiolipin synthase